LAWAVLGKPTICIEPLNVYETNNHSKSEIARQYAYLRKGKCTVFWINAQDTDTLRESFLFIARRLGKEVSDMEVAVIVFQNWCYET